MIKRGVLALLGAGLITLAGIGVGRWTIAGAEPFYTDPLARTARVKRDRDEPQASDFWSQQGVIAAIPAKRSVFDARPAEIRNALAETPDPVR